MPTAAVSRVCQLPTCGEVFAASAEAVRRGGGRFCSPSHAGIVGGRLFAVRHPQDGENNHNFKGWASRNKRSYVDRFRANHPEIAAAYKAVKLAIARGDLVRPAACQRCKRACYPHAHHEDYALPLDVVFVCRSCHRKLDEARRARLAQFDILNNVDHVPVRTVDLPVYELIDLRYDTPKGDARDHEGVAAPESINQLAR